MQSTIEFGKLQFRSIQSAKPGSDSRDDVKRFADFLDHCVESVRDAMDRGLSRAEVIDSIAFEDLLTPRHPGREQQRKNVARIHDQLKKD